MKHKSFFLLSGLLIFLFPAICLAAPVTVGSVSEPVTGGMMDGLVVIAEYANEFTSIGVWHPDTPSEAGATVTSGSATGTYDNGYTAFILSQGGDTYPSTAQHANHKWTLENWYYSRMISLTIIGIDEEINTGIVFDTRPDLEPNDPYSTPGSEKGIVDLTGNSVSAWYETLDEVWLQGEDHFYGDLYTGIKILFGTENEPGTLPAGQPFSFLLDTDTVTAVPIPGAFLLLGSGLLCLVGIKRRAR